MLKRRPNQGGPPVGWLLAGINSSGVKLESLSLPPFLQLCPVQPEGQEQRPVTASQRALFSQMHFIWHPWPKRPLGHADSNNGEKKIKTHAHVHFGVTFQSIQFFFSKSFRRQKKDTFLWFFFSTIPKLKFVRTHSPDRLDPWIQEHICMTRCVYHTHLHSHTLGRLHYRPGPRIPLDTLRIRKTHFLYCILNQNFVQIVLLFFIQYCKIKVFFIIQTKLYVKLKLKKMKRNRGRIALTALAVLSWRSSWALALSRHLVAGGAGAVTGVCAARPEPSLWTVCSRLGGKFFFFFQHGKTKIWRAISHWKATERTGSSHPGRSSRRDDPAGTSFGTLR